MDAVKFFKEMKRMCSKIQCDICSLRYTNNGTDFPCYEFVKEYPEVSVAIVKKWSAEHPIKTRQSKFLKMFPDAKFADGVIDIYPCQMNTKIKDDCSRLSPCFNCRKEYWLAEVE